MHSDLYSMAHLLTRIPSRIFWESFEILVTESGTGGGLRGQLPLKFVWGASRWFCPALPSKPEVTLRRVRKHVSMVYPHKHLKTRGNGRQRSRRQGKHMAVSFPSETAASQIFGAPRRPKVTQKHPLRFPMFVLWVRRGDETRCPDWNAASRDSGEGRMVLKLRRFSPLPAK